MSGTVTLSMEIELAWGTHDRAEYTYFSPDASAELETLTNLLDCCDRYKIPISFDVVGHLLHESCSGEHPGPHHDGWWSEDPGTDSERDPLFYAPEFVRMIENADVDHEICTHTYSHVLGDQVSADVIQDELAKASDVHEASGLEKPQSIVFPRHQTPSLAVLEDSEITTVRRPMDDYSSPSGIVRKFFWALRRTHPVTGIDASGDVLETFCTPHPSLSTGLLPIGQQREPLPLRMIPRPIRQKVHERYIRSAVKSAATTGGYVHLWSHLFNIANEAQWKPLQAGLEHIADKRDAGEITLRTMAELSEETK